MVHTMDIGHPEAYRHEAMLERIQTPELDAIGFERVIVSCSCDKAAWSGEYEIGHAAAVEDGGDAESDELILGAWMRHVYEQCGLPAPMYGPVEEQYAAVAEHYIDVIERTVANMREALSTPLSEFTEGRLARLLWAAQNWQDQGDAFARRLREIKEQGQ